MRKALLQRERHSSISKEKRAYCDWPGAPALLLPHLLLGLDDWPPPPPWKAVTHGDDPPEGEEEEELEGEALALKLWGSPSNADTWQPQTLSFTSSGAMREGHYLNSQSAPKHTFKPWKLQDLWLALEIA